MEVLSSEQRKEFLEQPCHFCSHSQEQGTEPDVLRIHELGFFPTCTFCKELIITCKLNYDKAVEMGKKVKEGRDSWQGSQSEFKNSEQAMNIKKSFAQQS